MDGWMIETRKVLYLWHVFVCAEIWTLRKIGKKYQESSERHFKKRRLKEVLNDLISTQRMRLQWMKF